MAITETQVRQPSGTALAGGTYLADRCWPGAVITSRMYRSFYDDNPPVVSVVAPTAGSTLASSSTALQVRVKDFNVVDSAGVAPAGTLKKTLVFITFTDGTPAEIAWTGTAFATKYSGSTATPIAGGYDFSFVRTGGWRTNPSATAYGVDNIGNDVTSTYSWVFAPADDVTPPTFVANTPAAGSTLTLNQSVTLDVADAVGTIARALVFATFGDGTSELVHSSLGFSSKYSAGSSTSSITGGTRYVIVRTGGWKQNPTFTAYARDNSGNEHLQATSLAYVYTPDVTSPALAANTPGAGTTLATNVTPIVVDVTDATQVGRVLVLVKFSTGEEEVAHDGTAWTAGYSASSTRTTVGTGFRFSVVRAAGWLTNPSVVAYGSDTLGNEMNLAQVTYAFTPVPPDTTPPSITGLTPTASTTLASQATPIAFTLTEGATGAVFVIASFAAGAIVEIVYDSSSGVSDGYSLNTTAAPSGSNRVFSIRRNAGWMTDPHLRVFATDAAGNVLDTTFSYTFVPPPVALPTIPFTVSYGADAQDIAPIDFGTDVLTMPDLDETLTVVGDKRVLAEAICRRLVTPRGKMAFHPSYGFDLRAYLNRPLRLPELAEIKAGVEDQCEEDERVFRAECAPEFNATTGVLRVPIEVETAEGPFALVVLIDNLNLTLLTPEGA